MSQVEESITVDVPVATAYNQWTQFQDFHHFMENVEQVQQLDDTHLRWTVTVGGRTETFDARITEQIPDTRIAWTSTDGPKHGGAVDFHPLDDDHTQVMVVMDGSDDPSIAEKVADKAGVIDRRVRADLKRFKEFIEERGTATGAWRGEVKRD